MGDTLLHTHTPPAPAPAYRRGSLGAARRFSAPRSTPTSISVDELLALPFVETTAPPSSRRLTAPSSVSSDPAARASRLEALAAVRDDHGAAQDAVRREFNAAQAEGARHVALLDEYFPLPKAADEDDETQDQLGSLPLSRTSSRVSVDTVNTVDTVDTIDTIATARTATTVATVSSCATITPHTHAAVARPPRARGAAGLAEDARAAHRAAVTTASQRHLTFVSAARDRHVSALAAARERERTATQGMGDKQRAKAVEAGVVVPYAVARDRLREDFVAELAAAWQGHCAQLQLSRDAALQALRLADADAAQIEAARAAMNIKAQCPATTKGVPQQPPKQVYKRRTSTWGLWV